MENGFKKTISYLNNNGKNETHTELVKAWSLQELTELLSSVGLQFKTVLGDYDLSEYQSDSPRLLIIAERYNAFNGTSPSFVALTGGLILEFLGDKAIRIYH